jgi:hypothetical protein
MNDTQAHQLMGRAYEQFALSPEFCESFHHENGMFPREFIATDGAQDFISNLPVDDPLRRMKESVDTEVKFRMFAAWKAARDQES